MFHKKHGFPQEDDIVLCTATNVQYNGVFCTLDEYENTSGMIHISEVSAGRIKNLREYVTEGKKIFCKVLRVDQERGHIDLSLRRVGEGARREKNMILRQEQKAEHIIEHLAKANKKDPAAFYQQVAPPILEHYEYLFMAFEDIAEGKFSLSQTSLDAKLVKLIEDEVKQRVKPKMIELEGVFSITTYVENGVAKVRDALVKARDTAKGDIRYLGAGKYHIIVSAEEFKDAEKRLKSAVESVEKAFKNDATSEVKFEQIETK